MRQSILQKRIYDRTRSGREQKGRPIVYAILSAFFVLSVIWFLFVSRYWSVTRIQVEGLRGGSEGLQLAEVEHAVYDALDRASKKPWDQRNIFFVQPNALAHTLQRALFAESVIVETQFPNILRLIIRERQRRVFLAAEGRLFAIDANGIISDTLVNEYELYLQDRLAGRAYADALHPPIMLVGSIETTSSGQRVVDPETIRGWIEIYHALLAAGFRFKTLQVDRVTSGTCKIAAEGNFDILMDLASPLKPQIETLRRFLQTKSKQTVITKYVDVRIPGKIFFQ